MRDVFARILPASVYPERQRKLGRPAKNSPLSEGASVWTEHNLRTIRTERLQAVALGLAWVFAGMLAMTLLLAIARYALARAADAATLAPSMMMF